MNPGLLKALSIAATAIGTGSDLVLSIVKDKKMDAKIEQKVLEALAKKGI